MEDCHHIAYGQSALSDPHVLINLSNGRKTSLEGLTFVPSGQRVVEAVPVVGQVQLWPGFHGGNGNYSDYWTRRADMNVVGEPSALGGLTL